ncbi:hypothetical protein HRG_010813 [Hirsutella rhossiliensis]|uniref:Uncharacterized protein n=1 Tax=Hirsutella rhossiliensis TaxID=111463 RepID=A0A9P8MMK7_9HYPO|nr:uncharacterized protein HRG_10813 [Hirsutella rhossiliensis]KAH0958118.1 hypothetical protein HRG_10813 [Hirsutella rhossiliensis]
MRRRRVPPLLLLCAAAGAGAARLVPGSGPVALISTTAPDPAPASASAALGSAHDPARHHMLARDSAPPPPYVPIVTPAPDQDAVLARQGLRQETYYACNTVGGDGASAHCGWHVPLVRTGGAAPPQTASTAAVVVGVACLAAVFALGMT